MALLGPLCLCKVKVRATCPLQGSSYYTKRRSSCLLYARGCARGCGETLVLPEGMATRTTFRETVDFCGQSQSFIKHSVGRGGGEQSILKKKSKAQLEKTVSRANCRSNNWDLVA